MQLLTSSGWNVACSIESVLLQIRLAIASLDPKPARLEAGPVRDYGVGEAVEAFKRACRAHNVRYLSSTIGDFADLHAVGDSEGL